MDIRKGLLIGGVLWVALCVGMLASFVAFTFQYLSIHYTQSWWGEWLVYHMIDLRWRAAAVSALLAAPGAGIALRSISTAQRRERKG